MKGCTDGVFNGKRYFFCVWGKGYFCQVHDLHPLPAIYHSTNAGTIVGSSHCFFMFTCVCI